MQIEICRERPGDEAAIRALHILTFGQAQEADIVDSLRRNDATTLSLVAVHEGQIIGHILYSPVMIDGRLEGAGLGPMSVTPRYQRQGVGSRLITAGNADLKRDGCPYIIVLGHPEYYPRFGFEPAGRYGVTCQWPVPDDAFMILVNDETRVQGVRGEARYRQEFETAV